MSPLNQPERRTRLWQFSLLYLLALCIPLGASYYLFSNNSLADENVLLKQQLDRATQEQKQLVTSFDTLTSHLQRIELVDQLLRDATNPVVRGRLETQNQDNLNDVAVSLSQLRADSGRLTVPAHRRLVRDELRDYDLFRFNRSTIDALREQIARSGNAAQENARLAVELGQARQELALLRAVSARPQAVAPSGGGGGGGTPAVSAGAKQQIALLQDEVDFANADCLRQRAYAFKPRSKERKQLLEQSRTEFIKILQDPATESLKSSIEKTLEPINVELGRPPRLFDLIGGGART